MVPLRLFAVRDFAIGNLTTFLMSGAIFAGGLLVTEEFQLARHYSPVGAGVRLLPFFATPMFVSPLAGALSDRIGRRPIIVVGLSLVTAGFVWVAWRGSLGTSWIELVIALLIAGVGISMALPTVPTAVLSAVAPHEMGKASGINYMAQRFGAVFAIAIGSAVFASYGGLGSPATVTAGFKPALWACSVFAVLAALAATAMSARPETSGRGRARGPANRRLNPNHPTNHPKRRRTMPNILHRLTIDAPPERVHELAATREGHRAMVDGPPGRRRRRDRRAAVCLLPRPRQPRGNLRSRRTQPGANRLAVRRRPPRLDRHPHHLRPQTPRRRRHHAAVQPRRLAAGERVHERLLDQLGRLPHEPEVRGRRPGVHRLPERRDQPLGLMQPRRRPRPVRQRHLFAQ